MSFKSILSNVTGQYDKLIAGVAVLLLLATLVFLGVGLSRIPRIRQDFENQIASMKPKFPQAEATDTQPYEEALNRLAEPEQLPLDWTNSLVVPELRVWCVDCRQPIGYHARECPFCKTVQPEPPKEPEDRDHDGMLNEWEEKHGLNPLDPADAGKDPDGDGFTNLEEHNARPQTDPKDKDDHPPVIDKIVIDEIIRRPFKFLFTSATTLPDGSKKFALNTRDRGRTYFLKLGDEVEGFTVHKFEPKEVEEQTRAGRVHVDRSILTLKKGNKLIPLTRGRPGSYEDLTVVLRYTQDDSKFTVEKGGTFELIDKAYTVLSIDSQKETVVIMRNSDGKRFPVERVGSVR